MEQPRPPQDLPEMADAGASRMEETAESAQQKTERQVPDTLVPETTRLSLPPPAASELVDDDQIDRLAEDLVLHEGNGIITRPIKPFRGSPNHSGQRRLDKEGGGNKDNNNNTEGKTSGSPRKSLTRRKPKAPTIRPEQRERVPKDGGHHTMDASTSRRKSGMEEFLDRVRQTSYLGSPDAAGLGGPRGNSGSGDSDLDDTDADDENSIAGQRASGGGNRNNRSRGMRMQLSSEDLEICRRLDDEYERALEEREIGYNARYASVRQSAFLSVFFLLAYMCQGTLVFMHQTEWSIPESLFFSIFTITTVGYGKEDLPTTPSFQAYTIFYIMVGIAALTIMVAQVYQCIALEATRAQHSRDKTAMKQKGMDLLHSNLTGSSNSNGNIPTNSNHSQRGRRDNGSDDGVGQHEIISDEVNNLPAAVELFFRWLDRARRFFRHTELGRGISVVFPFAGLILIGAVVVGPIEGWTFLEALYFSVVSLTTVGFGDYVPTELPSIWFCILWLPFSVGFMSMYLGNIAAFYIRLSDKNIRRIERQLRRRLQRAKESAELERAEVLRRAYRGQEDEIEAVISSKKDTNGRWKPPQPPLQSTAMLQNSEFDVNVSNSSSTGIPIHHAKSVASRQKNQDGFDMLPTSDLGGGSDNEDELFGGASAAADTGNRRRERIIENCRVSRNVHSNDSSHSSAGSSSNDGTMKSMRDVIRAVRNTMDSEVGTANTSRSDGDTSQFMSIRSTQSMTSHTMLRTVQTRKPSFGLRVLVQERFAEIIAIEVAGYHSAIDIKDYTLSVTINSLQETAVKWFIPGRARKAFRAVAFEVLYFVGEHGLITRGVEALYDLTPFEFHGLFSSLVAAMGDSDTMEGWLASTDTLALVDLHRTQEEVGSYGRSIT